MIRWKLHDPSGAHADFTFNTNPNQRDDPELDEPMTALPQQADGTLAMMPTSPTPQTWSFQGMAYSLADITAFEGWLTTGVVVLTDHFGEQYRIVVQDLDTVRRPSYRHPQRQQVTVHCLIFGKV